MDAMRNTLAESTGALRPMSRKPDVPRVDEPTVDQDPVRDARHAVVARERLEQRVDLRQRASSADRPDSGR